MKSYTGIGTGSLEVAMKSATKGLENPKMVIVFASFEEIENACKWIRNKYPETDVIGVMGSSYNNGKLIDSTNFSTQEHNNLVQVVGFFDDAEIACGIMDRLDSAPLYRIKEFEDNLKKVKGNHDNTVCIGFSTHYEENFVSTTKTILEKNNIELVGGSVSGAFNKPEEAFVILNDKKYERATVYCFIKNTVGKVKTYRNDIYKKTSSKLLQITKVSGEDNRILEEVNGQDIREVLKERLVSDGRTYDDKILDFTFTTPLGVVIGDETYVIAITTEKDGRIRTYKKVYEGGILTILEMGDYEANEKAVLEQMKKDLPNRSLILSVDCLYRYFAYIQNGYLDNYLNGMKSVTTNHAGLIGLGEQNTHQHFTQTMCCAVFE